jgi:hypothetical protein
VGLAENKDRRVYPGAPHGFHAGYRASYRKEAAEDAWSRMRVRFRKYKVLASHEKMRAACTARIGFKSGTTLSSRSRTARSVADLDRPDTPAVWGMYTASYDVAAALVSIVIIVVRIAVAAVRTIKPIAQAQPEAQRTYSVAKAAAVEATTMEASAMEAASAAEVPSTKAPTR